MSPTAEKLKAELVQLSMAERAELAHFLMDSLDEQEDAALDAAWAAELVRRTQEMQSGQVVGIPVEEMFRKIREQYS